MFNFLNLILHFSFFHGIGFTLNKSKLFMTIIKLYVSIVCCFIYLFYEEPFLYLKPFVMSFYL